MRPKSSMCTPEAQCAQCEQVAQCANRSPKKQSAYSPNKPTGLNACHEAKELNLTKELNEPKEPNVLP